MINKYLTVCSLLFTLVLGQEIQKPTIPNKLKDDPAIVPTPVVVIDIQKNDTTPVLINDIQPSSISTTPGSPSAVDIHTLNKSTTEDPSKHLNIISTTIQTLLAPGLNGTDKNDTMQYINRVISEYETGSNDFNVIHFLRYILFKSYAGVHSVVKLLSIMHLHAIYTTLITIYAVCATFIIHKFRKKSTTTISEIAMDHFHQIRGNDRRRKSENVKNIIKV